MSVRPGQDLLHYPTIEKICAGGMREVGCVRDTKLDRDVAVKMLPESMPSGLDREPHLQGLLNKREPKG